MSERYSFTTDYIYCNECAAKVRTAVEALDFSQTNRGLAEHKTSHIIAGFGGGLSPLDSRANMQQLRKSLAGKLCHPVRIAALYDNDTHEVFTIPSK